MGRGVVVMARVAGDMGETSGDLEHAGQWRWRSSARFGFAWWSLKALEWFGMVG
jgi:hypothetical protein